MVIKASAAAEIRGLVEALAGPDDVRREAAIARLSVIGPRAVPHVLAAWEGARDRATRIALLRALESSGDPRTAAVARAALSEGGDPAIAAIGVLRGLLDSPKGGAAALDQLMSAALGSGVERRVRLAAIDALQAIPGVRARLTAALSADPDESIRTRAAADGGHAAVNAVWNDAQDGHLPDQPAVLRQALEQRNRTAALSALHRLIDPIRAREAEGGPHRDDWRSLRGSVHQMLALRHSRVALYDLRETIEAADGPLPGSFLAAARLVGDASCLEALAGALGRADPGDARWRAQLTDAFRALAARERVTRRHAVMKRIAARWPGAARQLTDPS